MHVAYIFYGTIAGYLAYKGYQHKKEIANQEDYVSPPMDNEIIDEIIEDEIIEDEIIEDPMPISEYIRPYDMTKTGGIWRAIDPQSYIDPDHEVVQWFNRNTYLDKTGLHYLDDELVIPQYQSDSDYENKDHWMNADYYLSHDLVGDCEDFMIAIASILEAKSIPNMIVAITDGKNFRHVYLQYYYNDEYYVADLRYPVYQLRKYNLNESYLKAWMFNKDNTYMTYKEDWANIYY